MPNSVTPNSVTPEEVNAAVTAANGRTPFAACVELGPDVAVVRGAIDPSRSRPGGFVPGPLQFALADMALWYLTFGAIGRIELMALTQGIDIEFLRPAHGEQIWARAELLSAGSRKVVGTVRIWCDDRRDAPSAVAKGTYVLPRD